MKTTLDLPDELMKEAIHTEYQIKNRSYYISPERVDKKQSRTTKSL